ncbi:MAG: carbamoyltransferase HypF [Desulfobulbaceae bacterium]|nr:MAG: carbamoyltransferase HypF [Desulfobulbaceae bacterium]
MMCKNRKDSFLQSSPVRSSRTKRKSLQNGVEILVRGIVQGVGFRPFIFNLAFDHSITGSVTNTSEGVVIMAQADQPEQLETFIEAIRSDAPPLSEIHSVETRPLDSPLNSDSFEILTSNEGATSLAIIPPDIATCKDCLHELFDPADFRYRYPFINCTNCGPRLTITRTIPYDRPMTSMSVFPMCEVCEAEYQDPTNRRFHAQPNACPTCGPQLFWHDRNGVEIECEDQIDATIQAICEDNVVAMRGLGGFHLCVNGCSESAIETLRKRKNRPAKPLAIMVRSLAEVESLCHLDPGAAALLDSPEHPIVLLKPRAESPLASNLAPGVSDIGVMLPYTPLHHLLLAHPHCPEAMVMTSGNSSGDPICITNEDALQRLATIADNFLLHNREIITRVDDSVVKIIDQTPRLFRRARGYVPKPIIGDFDLPEIISCGAGLKSTFSLARGNTIFPSQHIGDLFNLSCLDFFSESVENLKKVFRIEPVAAACDLHPDYLSTHFAKELGLPFYQVQHHHAHAVAVMMEHRLTGPVLGVIMDGTGYGEDGTSWGGEILKADWISFERLASLEPLKLPGGDIAATEPWRMALSALFRNSGPAASSHPLFKGLEEAKVQTVCQMLEKGFNVPQTTSCGRLFDAVAAILGLNLVSSYEGQAAMMLESCAAQSLSSDWKDSLIRDYARPDTQIVFEKDTIWRLISSELIHKVVYDVSCGKKQSDIALQFHSWLICSISRLVEKLSGITGIQTIVLSGGCLQNRIFLEGLTHVLTSRGLETYSGSAIPPNDGGVSVGQAVIGGLRHVSRSTNES